MAILTLYPAYTVSAQTMEIDTTNLKLNAVIDNQMDTIAASVNGIQRDIILWHGADEYAAAGIWTNQTALDRAKELIESGNVKFA